MSYKSLKEECGLQFLKEEKTGPIWAFQRREIHIWIPATECSRRLCTHNVLYFLSKQKYIVLASSVQGYCRTIACVQASRLYQTSVLWKAFSTDFSQGSLVSAQWISYLPYHLFIYHLLIRNRLRSSLPELNNNKTSKINWLQ